MVAHNYYSKAPPTVYSARSAILSCKIYTGSDIRSTLSSPRTLLYTTFLFDYGLVLSCPEYKRLASFFLTRSGEFSMKVLDHVMPREMRSSGQLFRACSSSSAELLSLASRVNVMTYSSTERPNPHSLMGLDWRYRARVNVVGQFC